LHRLWTCPKTIGSDWLIVLKIFMGKNQDKRGRGQTFFLPGAAEDLEPTVHGSTNLHAEMYSTCSKSPLIRHARGRPEYWRKNELRDMRKESI